MYVMLFVFQKRLYQMRVGDLLALLLVKFLTSVFIPNIFDRHENKAHRLGNKIPKEYRLT